MKIEKIIYYTNEKDNIFNNCVVYYEDGTSQVTNNVMNVIFEFMSQEGLTLNEVIKDPRVINGDLIKKQKRDADIFNKNLIEHNNQVENQVHDVDKYSRSQKIRKKIITITSITTAFILTGAALSYFINKSKSRSFSRNNINIEQNVNDSNEIVINTITPTPEINPKNTPVIVEKTNTTTDDEYNDVFRENLQDTIDHIDPLTRNILKLYNGEKLDEDELLYTINGINRLCQSNMAEVEKLIENGNMSGDKILLLFDEIFPSNSIENIVLTSFTTRRNEIVENAYYQDKDLTMSEVNDYNDFFLDYIFGDVTFEHNGKRYGYYDISPIARYIVFMLGQTTLETNHNYSKNINDKNCDFNTIISRLEDSFDLVTSQLFEGGRKR